VKVGQGSPLELAAAIEGLVTSAEKAGRCRDGVQSLRRLVTECKDVFRLKLGADSPANVRPLVLKLRDGAEPVRTSARKCAPPQLNFMRDMIRELEELNLMYKNTEAEWTSPPRVHKSDCMAHAQPSRRVARPAWLRSCCYTGF
jgi:hypothetical protein